MIVRVQEEERERFAQELHEGIGQNLSAVLMQLQDFRSERSSDPKGPGSEMEELLRRTIQDVRSLSHGLMPRLLKEFGLTSALEDLKRRMEDRLSLDLELEVSIREARVEDRIKIGVYRIVQELVEFCSNVRRTKDHRLQIHEEADKLVLNFKDEGASQDPSTGGSIKDLRRFDSMVRSMHGSLELLYDDLGTPSVEMRIPLR
jgi:signal transduction histidine kinase